jgi:hypothetical protein
MEDYIANLKEEGDTSVAKFLEVPGNLGIQVHVPIKATDIFLWINDKRALSGEFKSNIAAIS